MSPGPWAALVWVPLMLAAPVAAMGRNALGWVGLVVVAATAVAALFTAFPQHGARGRRGRIPDILLAVQAVATVVTVTTLPVDVSLWLWVLLGLSLGAAAHPWWGPWRSSPPLSVPRPGSGSRRAGAGLSAVPSRCSRPGSGRMPSTG